jgi:hypothetical protein
VSVELVTEEVIITDEEAKRLGLCRHDVRHIAVRKLRTRLYGRDYIDGYVTTRYDQEGRCVIAYVDYSTPWKEG